MIITEYYEDDIFSVDDCGRFVKEGKSIVSAIEFAGEMTTVEVNEYGRFNENDNENNTIISVDICKEALSA